MQIYAVSAIINGIASLFLGFFVFSQNRSSVVNRLFGLLTASVVIWSFGYFFWQIATSEESALFWIRFFMMGAIMMPPLFIHFILRFLNIHTNLWPQILIRGGYILASFFLIANLTSYFVQNVSPKLLFPFWPNPGIIFHIFLFAFIGYMLYGLIVLYHSSKKSSGTFQGQVFYLFFALLIGAIAGSTNYFLWYNIPIPPVGNWIFWFFAAIIAYAIVKKQLFDIKIALSQFIVFAMGSILLAQIFTSSNLAEYLWRIIFFLVFIAFGVLLVKSVTQEIQQKEELQKAYEDLKRLDKAKSEFVSIASHQLRTPLTAIKGYLSMLMESAYGKLSKKQEKIAANVYQSNERLIHLVNDLLSLSRIESGKIEVQKESINIEKLTQEVVNELSIKAKEKNIDLNIKTLEENLPLFFLDTEKTRNILLNILDNAIRYTEKGSVSVEIMPVYENEILVAVQIQIQDTGEGMEQEEIEGLFESFRRGKAGQQIWTEGAGLGLYIAKRFLELQSGTISATSQGKGKGSTFIIELPYQTNT